MSTLLAASEHAVTWPEAFQTVGMMVAFFLCITAMFYFISKSN